MKNFTVISALGEGTFSRVYEATRRDTLEHVAIKVISKRRLLHGPTARSNVKALHREKQIISVLGQHPNIICCRSVFQDKSNLYFVMDLIKGPGTLADVLKKFFPEGMLKFLTAGTSAVHSSYHQPFAHASSLRIPPQDATVRDRRAVCSKYCPAWQLLSLWVADLINILIALRERHVAHRDIKPENILVDEFNRLILIDFNAGMIVEPIASRGNKMSPEKRGVGARRQRLLSGSSQTASTRASFSSESSDNKPCAGKEKKSVIEDGSGVRRGLSGPPSRLYVELENNLGRSVSLPPTVNGDASECVGAPKAQASVEHQESIQNCLQQSQRLPQHQKPFSASLHQNLGLPRTALISSSITDDRRCCENFKPSVDRETNDETLPNHISRAAANQVDEWEEFRRDHCVGTLDYMSPERVVLTAPFLPEDGPAIELVLSKWRNSSSLNVTYPSGEAAFQHLRPQSDCIWGARDRVPPAKESYSRLSYESSSRLSTEFEDFAQRSCGNFSARESCQDRDAVIRRHMDFALKMFPPESSAFSGDLWAVGCILFELVFGYHPFIRNSSLQTVDAIINRHWGTNSKETSLFRKQVSCAPEALQVLLQGLLSYHPSERLGTTNISDLASCYSSLPFSGSLEFALEAAANCRPSLESVVATCTSDLNRLELTPDAGQSFICGTVGSVLVSGMSFTHSP